MTTPSPAIWMRQRPRWRKRDASNKLTIKITTLYAPPIPNLLEGLRKAGCPEERTCRAPQGRQASRDRINECPLHVDSGRLLCAKSGRSPRARSEDVGENFEAGIGVAD